MQIKLSLETEYLHLVCQHLQQSKKDENASFYTWKALLGRLHVWAISFGASSLTFHKQKIASAAVFDGSA